ncbi:hypothetical protein ACHAXS_009116 [Conticribra weissflogii]
MGPAEKAVNQRLCYANSPQYHSLSSLVGMSTHSEGERNPIFQGEKIFVSNRAGRIHGQNRCTNWCSDFGREFEMAKGLAPVHSGPSRDFIQSLFFISKHVLLPLEDDELYWAGGEGDVSFLWPASEINVMTWVCFATTYTMRHTMSDLFYLRYK